MCRKLFNSEMWIVRCWLLWQIVFDTNGRKVLQEQDNPKYYLCKRFFTDEKYIAFSKLPCDEIVSVDSMLFPVQERILLDKKTASSQRIRQDEQILMVSCFDDLLNNTPMVENIENFSFCGYDLAEEFEISALTNCGGFDETFTYKDLNAFGLLPDFATAQKMQMDLEKNNPEEEHADCLLFAIWRRIG